MNPDPHGTEKGFSAARFGLLSACLIFACFPGVILGREAFFFRDFAIFSYPLAAYHKFAFAHGAIPLWNPYNDCGLPFLAQWNTMVLYPLSLIYLLLPLSWALSFFSLFHMWFAALGMFFLARAWTGSNRAAALAGLAYIFNGVILSCLKWPNTIAALSWMPWVILCAERALTGNRRAFAMAALVGACQMLTGAPEIIFLTWGFAGALWIWTGCLEKTGRLRIVTRFPLLVAFVAGLCAVQLLPFLDLLQHSQRGEGFRGAQWSMPPWGWANFLLPLFRMFPSYHNVHAQPGQYWISTYYVSIGAGLLAIVALATVRRGPVRLLGVLLFFSMWMALGEGGGLYKWLRALVPGLSMMRYPIKFIVLAAFILPLLGAIGLQSLLSEKREEMGRLVWGSALILGAAIAGLIVYSELNPFRSSLAFLTAANGAWRLTFLAAMALVLSTRHRSAWSVPLLLALLVADGLTHTTWQNPVTPRWVYEESPVEMIPFPKLGFGRAMISPEAAETLDHLKLDTPLDDVLASRLALFCNLNLLELIPKVDGFYSIYPRDAARLQDLLYGGTNLPPAGILNFLGVTQITAPGSWHKWVARETALPWVTSPARARFATGGLDDLFSAGFTPRDEVLLDPGAGEGETNYSRAKIEGLEWEPQSVRLKASVNSPAMLVFAQTFYHWWTATIDGKEAEILHANRAFQAVRVPAGAHTVTFDYKDRAFQAGGIVSFICAGLLTILLRSCGNKVR